MDAEQNPTPATPKLSREGCAANWTRPSVMVLVLANLIPLIGVVVWRWEVFPLLLLFWFENVIIGVFNALKMLLASPDQPLTWGAKLFMIPFFSFHFGMFTFVHGIFVMVLFGNALRPGRTFPTPSTFWETACELKLQWAILGLAVSHAVSFATNYLGHGEFRRANLPVLMQQPYGRIVVLHLTILLGGFLMTALKSPVAGLALLVVLKIALDLRGHLRERRKFAAGEPAIS